MRRRICLVGAALCAFPLAFGVATAVAAKSKAPASKHKAARTAPAKSGPNTVKVTCTTNVGLTVAPGDTDVTLNAPQGSEYGPATCGKSFGAGVQADAFTVPDGGNTLAKFTLYFHTGTIHGTYVLVPQEGAFNFLETDYTGTIKVAGGTGSFQGFKGTGTSTCKTLDSIHTTCKDHLKLKGPATG